jgi:hypothetical protein
VYTLVQIDALLIASGKFSMRCTRVTSKVSQKGCESFTKDRLDNVMFFVWIGCCVHRGMNAVKWAVKHIVMSRIYKEKKAKPDPWLSGLRLHGLWGKSGG